MAGYFSNGSYDIHREISAKVIGVLKYNNDIRKKLLERNIGFYNQLNPDEGIGYISNVYSNETSKPFSFNKNGLLGYTHFNNAYISNGVDGFFNKFDGKDEKNHMSEYQKQIYQKYDLGNDYYYYNAGSLPDINVLRWNGEYRDYRDYISELTNLSIPSFNLLSEFFKKDKLLNPTQETTLTIQSVIYDFIQYDNIKYAMEKNRIGTINPNPLAALLGAVTTNINNFSGKDTTLGLITNQLYANTLQRGATFNSLRKTQYITPEVHSKLGNKLSTIATLGADFRIDEETGRLAFDLGDDFNGTYNLENEDFDSLFGNKDYWKQYIIENKNIFNNDYLRLKNLKENHLSINQTHFYLPFNNYSYARYDKLKGQLIQPSFSKSINSNHTWFEGVNKYHALAHDTDNNNINSIIIDDNSLLKKTHNLFKRHDDKGIDTLIGRYHTSGDRDTTHNEKSLLQTAVNKHFGMSHGRNLLTKEAYKTPQKVNKEDNDYTNPYCRVWTKSSEYGTFKDLIRPFVDENGSVLNINKIQEPLQTHIRTSIGTKRLNYCTSLNNNGFVNITPTYGIPSVKKCMFSIENLAWKDYGNMKNLSKEQIGPNGGRIMWFPPYDLKFQENINVNWGSNDFIGRGEKIYTYTNTERSGTLSFILLVDNPSILSEWKNYGEKEYNVDDQEQQLLRFFAGCEPLKLRDRGYDKSYKYKEEVTTTWEEVEYIQEPYEPKKEYINEKDLVFYIFFPNNYSGINDDFDDALKYLINDYDSDDYSTEGLIPKYEGLDWCYRVDEVYKNQKLKPGNYKDLKSYDLNNYSLLKIFLNKLEKFGVSKDEYSDVTHSLKQINDNYKSILAGKIIDKVILESGSTSVGTNSMNKTLSKNRMLFGKKFVEKILKIKDVEIEMNDKNSKVINIDITDASNVSSLRSKLNRFVKVILKTKELKYNNLTDTFKNSLIKDHPEINEKIEKTFQNVLLQRKVDNYIDKVVDGENFNDALINSVNEQRRIDEFMDKVNESHKNAKYVNTKRVVHKKSKTDIVTKTGTMFVPESPHRSDEEHKYFEMLQSRNSFLYNKLVEKIRYFSPAFHSITPEGFNSRLSFLHQCTRQGFTDSVSDNNNTLKSAGNLSFGRPPICILRIGDFYHTKIVIQSLMIDFNDSTLDMNPEGIGLQPMFARITLNFVFLGGSDLGAPISRLQNALSFNYYANQSVYDDRADMGTYDINNSTPLIFGKPWKPDNK